MDENDIFHLANKIDGFKHELTAEIFLFNKNYVPYVVRLDRSLEQSHIDKRFIYDLVGAVNKAAAIGMSIRDIELGEDGDSILHAKLKNVGRAETLLHLIENERNDIMEFDPEQHDFSRNRGIIARYTHPTEKDLKFYVVKQLNTKQGISGSNAWEMKNDGSLGLSTSQVTMNIPQDNQVLIKGPDIFVFSNSKFKDIFSYDAHEMARIERAGKAIDEAYQLSMPTIGQGIAFMAREKRSIVSKMLKVIPGLVPQQKVLEIADEYAIELMADDEGRIILMDLKDVEAFIDIISENFYRSEATGITYRAKSKQQVEEDE